MRFAVAVLLAAAAACDSFTASDPSRLTFGGGDGLEADSADGAGDGSDVQVPDIMGDDADTALVVDGVDDTIASDGNAEDIVAAEEVTGEIVADSDTAEEVEELPDIPETDGESTDDTEDDVADVPDADESDSSDAILTDADGTDGSDDTDTTVITPDDTEDDVATTDSTDASDATDGNEDIIVPADSAVTETVDDEVTEDTGASDGSDGDIVEPPDSVIEEDIPVVDKCLGVVCDTSDPCAVESCDSTTGECVVSNPALADNVGCEDGDFCTVGDVCDAGLCLSGEVNPEVCQCTTTSDCAHLEDDTLCTKPVSCVENVCVLGALVHCADDNPCSYNLCIAQTGLCSFPSVPACCRQDEECDDNNVCTKNWCELSPGPDQNMCFSENLAVACDDGDICTVGDHCSVSTGACIAGDIAECDDGDPCTKFDTCFNGGCVGKVMDCSDEDPCTQGEGCAAGVCVTPTPTDCSDADVCTLDSCAPGTGCIHETYEPFVVFDNANEVLSTGSFKEWITADQGFHAGPWCAIGSTCGNEIGIHLTGDSASLTIDLAAVGDHNGVPKVLEFTIQHHYDIIGVAFPTMEIRLNGDVIDSNVFDGPSEKYSRGGTQPPLNLGSAGTVVITLKRNGAKVSTSPVFQQTFHFIGELLIRDACH